MCGGMQPVHYQGKHDAMVKGSPVSSLSVPVPNQLKYDWNSVSTIDSIRKMISQQMKYTTQGSDMGVLDGNKGLFMITQSSQ